MKNMLNLSSKTKLDQRRARGEMMKERSAEAARSAVIVGLVTRIVPVRQHLL